MTTSTTAMMMVKPVLCRYEGGTKLFSCRNAAGLTAAKLAAKHDHVACAQLLSFLKKLSVHGAGGPAGDGRPSAARETSVPAAAPTVDNAGDAAAGNVGDDGTEKKPGDARAGAPRRRTGTDVLPEIVEVPGKVASAGVARVSTDATTNLVASQAVRRCMSALPAAHDGNHLFLPFQHCICRLASHIKIDPNSDPTTPEVILTMTRISRPRTKKANSRPRPQSKRARSRTHYCRAVTQTCNVYNVILSM